MIKCIQHIVNGVIICVNPKIELMGILITLSDESLIDKFKRLFEFDENNDKYINVIKKEFSYLIENGFITRFNKIKKKYHLHYQEPIKLMLMLDDGFDSKVLEAYCWLKPEKDFYNFINELKELYKSSKFIEFYSSNKYRYNKWIESLVPFYEKYNILNIISTYCGDKYNSLKLYNDLIAFETNGGYGIYLDDEAHYCSRANSSQNTCNLFAFDIDTRLKIVIHEFLHSVINPITDKYNIFTCESNILKKVDDLSFRGYSTDYSLINETIVRAITIRLYSNIIEKADSKSLLDLEYKQGFKHIKNIYGLLLEYEHNRNVYLDIDSFYEKIVSNIINAEKQEI